MGYFLLSQVQAFVTKNVCKYHKHMHACVVSHRSVHAFAEGGLRTFFDIIAITCEKGAKSSPHRALPNTRGNHRYIGSTPCQQISPSLYGPFRYSGPRYIGPPTVLLR